MYITSYSIRIVLLSLNVNIYGTMAPMSLPDTRWSWIKSILLGGISCGHWRSKQVAKCQAMSRQRTCLHIWMPIPIGLNCLILCKIIGNYCPAIILQLQIQRLTYRDSPLKPIFSRVLAVGDALGIQSPLSFGGFGA